MAESQYHFDYSGDDGTKIKAALTEPRLGKYLQKANFDFDHAMDLYLWNARLAKSLQFPLHVMEVAVRNAICSHLTLSGAPDDWAFDNSYVESLASKNTDIMAALNRSKYLALKDKMKPDAFRRQVKSANYTHIPSFGFINTNDVIANMSLEFWMTLLDSEFEDEWQLTLRKVFPFVPASIYRKDVWRFVLDSKVLRNRIAHYKPIFHLTNLVESYRQVHQLIGFRCKATAGWTTHHSTFYPLWHSPPQPSRTTVGLPLIQFAHQASIVTDETISISRLLEIMKGKKRDFAVVQSAGAIKLIVSEDISRYLMQWSEIGFADLKTSVAEFLKKNPLSSRLALVRNSATTGEARAIFSPRDTPNKEKPTAIVITSDGTEMGNIEGLVFKPDFT
ncbi:Abi family protein [Rhizobium leguminosarum]